MPAVGQADSGKPGRAPTSHPYLGGEDRTALCSCDVGLCNVLGAEQEKCAEAAKSRVTIIFYLNRGTYER